MSYTEPPPADNTAYKAAALQALATGGSAAKAALDTQRAAYEQSRQTASADAMRAAQQYGLAPAAGKELAAITDRPYNVGLAAMDTKIGAVTRGLDQIAAPLSRVFDTKFAATQARQARGGSGGGGGGSTKPEAWWTKDLQANYDTKENLYSSILQDVSGQKAGLPSYLAARKTATEQYGVPAGAAAAQYKPSAAYQQWAASIAPGVKKGVTLKQFQQEVHNSGLPLADRDYLVAQYQQAAQPNCGRVSAGLTGLRR